MLCLVLTDPYDYERVLSAFMQKARERGQPASVVFYIPTDALHNFVEELGEKGWLGSSPIKTLENSMLDGLKTLGKSILEYAHAEADKVQVELYTKLLLGTNDDLEQYLNQSGCDELIFKHSPWFTSEEA